MPNNCRRCLPTTCVKKRLGDRIEITIRSTLVTTVCCARTSTTIEAASASRPAFLPANHTSLSARVSVLAVLMVQPQVAERRAALAAPRTELSHAAQVHGALQQRCHRAIERVHRHHLAALARPVHVEIHSVLAAAA